MLSPTKKVKLISALKYYKKEYLDKGYAELDESATRLMINHFLTDVLGYKMIEEIKTEYMIRGAYADYVIQIHGNRHVLVEVKGYSLELSGKHLRHQGRTRRRRIPVHPGRRPGWRRSPECRWRRSARA